MHRQLCALAAAAVGVAMLSACEVTPKSTFEDGADLRQKITAVRLDGIGSGRVTVRGGAAEASLRRTLRYRDDRPDGPTHRVRDGVLTLSGCGSGCSVDYTVQLPAGVPVSGGTSSGSISLTRVGPVEVTTNSGSIRLDGVAGTVKARTSNGRIEAAGLKGTGIDVQTSNGEIKLAPATAQSVRAKTSNGDITVTSPAGRYKISTRTGSGDKDITVPNDPSAAHLLDLTTGNGDITVTPV
ncbi:DUF4097 family beta strand repeat-containing protein [Spirillospora sp. NPDC050679]